MKRILLTVFAMAAMFAAISQNFTVRGPYRIAAEAKGNFDEGIIKSPNMINTFEAPERPVANTKSVEIVTIIPIGQAVNGFGLYNGGRTAIWADNNLNTVAVTHRMTNPPGGGYLAYDLSTDGGWTWATNIQVYNPTAGGANARYPQGVIYNPVGNTDPNNALYSYFGPTLDGSNTGGASWGGYCGGTHRIDQSTIPTQHDWSSLGAYRQNVPSSMHLNPVTNDIWVFEAALVDGLGNQYTDSMLITRGTLDIANNDYTYTRSLMYLPTFTPGQAPACEKIAFAPDGMTGYMSLIFDNGGSAFEAGWSYYPVLLKTTDGGETWSDPIAVTLSGPNGLHEVKHFLSDADWSEIWVNPELVHRDSVKYTCAFFHDLVVDLYGNPHICVTIGISGYHGTTPTAYSIIHTIGAVKTAATFHIFSQDQGQTFMASHIQTNETFRGEFGGGTPPPSEDNRSQASITHDGSKVFLSWLDTHFEGVADNIMPDIWCVGYDVVTQKYTDSVYNVTFLSDAWLSAFMGTASYYVFEEGTDYIIPFVYQTMPGGDMLNPVDFMYIADFTINQADFTLVSTDDMPARESTFNVSQNYPNPVKGTTQFIVELDTRAQVNVDVYNIMGQMVHTLNRGVLNTGRHPVQLDMNGYAPGLYLYTVRAGDRVVTRKMLVE